MDPFTTIELSPRTVEPRRVDLPFGLTWGRLAPAMPGLVEDRAEAECIATCRFELRGLRDERASMPLTLHHPVAGGSRAVDVFVKRTPVDAPEAPWYRLLADAAVPVADLLVEATSPDGGDAVIVLGFLEVIGIDFEAAADVDELLRLLARLNAVDVAVPRGPRGLPEDEFTRRVRAALARLDGVDVDAWLAAYEATKRSCASMPLALTHGEMYFQHVGRRRRDHGPLVLLDLATLGLRPRFTDVAGVVGALSRRTGDDEPTLFGRYRRELADLGVDVPAIDEAMPELRMVRANGAFAALPWLVDAQDHPDVGPALLADRVTVLRHDLVLLGLLG